MDRKNRIEEQRERERVARSKHELAYTSKISKTFSVEEQLRVTELERRQHEELLRKKLLLARR